MWIGGDTHRMLATICFINRGRRSWCLERGAWLHRRRIDLVVGGMHGAVVGTVATCAEGEGHESSCGFCGFLCGGGDMQGRGH